MRRFETKNTGIGVAQQGLNEEHKPGCFPWDGSGVNDLQTVLFPVSPSLPTRYLVVLYGHSDPKSTVMEGMNHYPRWHLLQSHNSLLHTNPLRGCTEVSPTAFCRLPGNWYLVAALDRWLHSKAAILYTISYAPLIMTMGLIVFC